MRPRHSLRRWRVRPYHVTPAWRSARKPLSLLEDFPLAIMGKVPDMPTANKRDEKLEKERRLIEKGSKEEWKKGEDEGKERIPKEDRKEEQEENGDKTWYYSVDVSGYDNVRAFTEGGLLVVEGRGDGSSGDLRHVTTLPAHVRGEALRATQKAGRLSFRCCTTIPVVVNIPISKDPDESLETKLADGKQTPEAKSNDSQEPNDASGDLAKENNYDAKAKSATWAA